MHAIQRSRIDSDEVERLVEEIDRLIKQSDHLLSARDVQKQLDEESSQEAIAKALRTAIERGIVEITTGMKLKVGTQLAPMGQ